MAQIPAGGGSGGSGWVKITDIAVSGGTATDKVYQDAPGNTVLQSATVSSLTFQLSVSAGYPLITIGSTDYVLSVSADGGHYEDTVAVTISASGTVSVVSTTPDGVPGAIDSMVVTAVLPAEFTSLLFTGGYPGAQTELKEDDNFSLSWTTDSPIDGIQISAYGALKTELITFASASSGTVTVDIADQGDVLQTLTGRARPRDATSGALGAELDTNAGGGGVNMVNTLEVNNLHPTINFPGPVSYPGTQGALKDVESGTVPISIANASTVVFDSPNGDVSILNPSTIETPKTVTRIAGTYNISVNNLRATGNRAPNDATTIDQTIVRIAHVDAVIVVTEATTRVRSGVAPGADTVITITSNQQLLNAPTMDPAASRGTFQGSWAGGPSVYTRSLRVPDSENPADNSLNTWINLVATNLAGKVQNTIDISGFNNNTYVVGGFTTRTLNYLAFIADSTETFPLTTEGNLSVGVFSNGNPGVVQPFGTADTTDVGKEGWCAPTAATGIAVQMHMLHSDMVIANAAGLTLTLVEETP